MTGDRGGCGRVLLADPEPTVMPELTRALRSRGLDVAKANSYRGVVLSVAARPPDAVVLGFHPDVTVELAARLKERAEPPPPEVVGVLPGRGARAPDPAAPVDDWLMRPVRALDAAARVHARIRARADRIELRRENRELEALVELSRILSAGTDLDGLLDLAAARIAEALGARRCSILLLDERDRGSAVVAASSDGPAPRGRRIDLSAYPEVRWVVEKASVLIVPDVRNEGLLEEVRDALSGLPHDAEMLFPILDRDRPVGVLFVRDAREGRAFPEHEVHFCRIVANTIGPTLGAARQLRQALIDSRRERWLRAEAEGRLERQRFLVDALDGAPVGLAAVDPARAVLFVNRTAADLLGLPAESLVGRPLAECFAPEAADTLDRLCFSPAGPEALPLRQPVPGGPRWVRLAFTRMPGEEQARIAVFHDVSEQRDVEELLRATAGRLAESERRAALAALAGAAAHELNQPLTAIMGTIELAEVRGQVPEELKSIHASLYAEAERMAEIVKRIGGITRFTTTPYVGGSEILDLRRSSE